MKAKSGSSISGTPPMLSADRRFLKEIDIILEGIKPTLDENCSLDDL